MLSINLIYSQSKEDVAKIVGSYDLSKIKELQSNLKQKTTLEKQKAEAAAIINNWPIRVVGKDGSISELMKLYISHKALKDLWIDDHVTLKNLNNYCCIIED